MALSDISIKKPVFAWMLMFALIIFGWVGFSRLGISQYPDIDFPVLTINLTMAGASPEDMEASVVDVIEEAVMPSEGLKDMTSQSYDGMATITLEFQLGRSIDSALQEVQTRIASVQRKLPVLLDPPVILKTNPEDQPILWVGLFGDRSPRELSDIARYQIRDRILTAHPGVGGIAEGISDIIMGGYLERNMRVWCDTHKLEAYQLTVNDVLNAIQNEHLEVPAGRVEGATREMNVRMMSEASNTEQFRKLLIAQRNGSQILLGDVALVENGLEDFRRIARSNGMSAQGLGVKKMRGSNAIEVANAVKETVKEIQKTLPPDLHLEVVFDTTKPIQDSIHEIEFNMVLSIILTSLVCWLFLGSWSAAFNVILAIPTSLMGTFMVMYFLGFTLNTFTLMALLLSVGIVVDDAIMVLENIYRHAEGGKGRKEAAIFGAREITFAALAATSAIVAIFLPVAFMQGIIGKFFLQFGICLSVCVMFSLLEAITITPARCSQMLQTERKGWLVRIVDDGFQALARGYGQLLKPCLRLRYVIVVVALILFAGSLTIVGSIGKEFVPSQDQGRVFVTVKAPTGSSIWYTNKLMHQCEELVAAHPEINRYFCAIGGFTGGIVDQAIMFITMVPYNERTVSQQQLMDSLRKELNAVPGLLAFPLDLSTQGLTAQRGFPIEFNLQGQKWDELVDSAQQLMRQMRASGLMVDVDTDYRVGMPEVEIVPNRERMADLHVSAQAVGNVIAAMMGGARLTANPYKENGHQYDVRVRLISSQRLRPEDIRHLWVKNDMGQLIRLTDLVTVREVPALQVMNRRMRQRTITVYANVAQGKSQSSAMEELQKMTQTLVKPGQRILFTGGSRAMQESFQSLIFALVLGIIVAYMILASQFNSFIHPITVLAAVPFSVTGALIALWLGNFTLNVYSIIGMILLIGIVKKNSIILVDYTNQRREQGLSVREALLQACPIRLRPILMTSIATMVGAIPPALALGPGGELRTPMAFTIIGGVFLSTCLTLFVVPCIYMIFEDFKHRFSRKGASAPVEQSAP